MYLIVDVDGFVLEGSIMVLDENYVNVKSVYNIPLQELSQAIIELTNEFTEIVQIKLIGFPSKTGYIKDRLLEQNLEIEVVENDIFNAND